MDCGEVELWSRLEFGFRDASWEVEDSEGLEVWSSQEKVGSGRFNKEPWFLHHLSDSIWRTLSEG